MKGLRLSQEGCLWQRSSNAHRGRGGRAALRHPEAHDSLFQLGQEMKRLVVVRGSLAGDTQKSRCNRHPELRPPLQPGSAAAVTVSVNRGPQLSQGTNAVASRTAAAHGGRSPALWGH